MWCISISSYVFPSLKCLISPSQCKMFLTFWAKFPVMCYFQSVIRYIIIWTKIKMNTQFLFPLRLWLHWLSSAVPQCHCVRGLSVLVSMPSILAQRGRMVRCVCTWQRWSELVSIHKISEIHTCAYSANLTSFQSCSITQETSFHHHPHHQSQTYSLHRV